MKRSVKVIIASIVVVLSLVLMGGTMFVAKKNLSFSKGMGGGRDMTNNQGAAPGISGGEDSNQESGAAPIISGGEDSNQESGAAPSISEGEDSNQESGAAPNISGGTEPDQNNGTRPDIPSEGGQFPGDKTAQVTWIYILMFGIAAVLFAFSVCYLDFSFFGSRPVFGSNKKIVFFLISSVLLSAGDGHTIYYDSDS